MSALPQDYLGDLLSAVERGEPDAFGSLVEAVYPELKKLAHFQLLGERPNHTLNTTAIVHEAFVRLSGSEGNWTDRRHFLRASSKVMRHLEDAINNMRDIDPRLVEIVECRFFAGLSVSDTAEALDTSVRTVERGSQRAQAYLLGALDNKDE